MLHKHSLDKHVRDSERGLQEKLRRPWNKLWKPTLSEWVLLKKNVFPSFSTLVGSYTHFSCLGLFQCTNELYGIENRARILKHCFTFLITVTKNLSQGGFTLAQGLRKKSVMERTVWKVGGARSGSEKPRECGLFYLRGQEADSALLGSALICDLPAFIYGSSSARKVPCTKRPTTSQNGQPAGDQVFNPMGTFHNQNLTFGSWYTIFFS